MKPLLVVGAGFSGAVLARELATAGHAVQVIDSRDHIGGNCHTQRDGATGVLVHTYGPHIFHTANAEVQAYVQRFGEWMPFVNRVKADTGSGVFSLPVNLHTINQFFGKTFTPGEARAFISAQADASIGEPANFEEQALKFVGRDLYEAFFRDYTFKQWGCDPRELPASLLRRLPLRFDYNDNYYDSPWQALPREGYTAVVARILEHPGIRVQLSTPWDPAMRRDAAHVFFSGALDQFYGFSEGRLGYRTVWWEREVHEGDYQGGAVINHTRLNVPWTRVLEHKHFAPWETHARSLVTREYSRETAVHDTPYYPKRLAADHLVLQRYLALAGQESGVSFMGRLGTYRYLDMDRVIAEALALARSWLAARADRKPLPVFSAPPV
jgi:UDP-galactopyranose mutase